MKYFGLRPPVNPIPATLPHAPVAAGARGDYVWMVMEGEQKDPRDPQNKTYHFNTFAVLRIENGKIRSTGAVPGGTRTRPWWNTAFPEASVAMEHGQANHEEKKTLALATEEIKDMLQYGHLEVADKTMDPGYIQHNPNVPQGPRRIQSFHEQGSRPDSRTDKKRVEQLPVLTLIDGPYSLMMFDRRAKDPADPSKDYVWNHFDLIRVENGMSKEHWDESVIAPPQPSGKMQ